MYVSSIENDSDRTFFKTKISSEITFLHAVHVTLIIMSRNFVCGFSKLISFHVFYPVSQFRSPDLPFDIRFWTRGCLGLVMRSRKAGFPFAVRVQKRELCLQRYVSRMTLTENCLSQNLKFFSLNPLFLPGDPRLLCSLTERIEIRRNRD